MITNLRVPYQSACEIFHISYDWTLAITIFSGPYYRTLKPPSPPRCSRGRLGGHPALPPTAPPAAAADGRAEVSSARAPTPLLFLSHLPLLPHCNLAATGRRGRIRPPPRRICPPPIAGSVVSAAGSGGGVASPPPPLRVDGGAWPWALGHAAAAAAAA